MNLTGFAVDHKSCARSAAAKQEPMAGRIWGQALLGAAVVALGVARWLPAGMRDWMPWVALLLGLAGLVVFARGRGRRWWEWPLAGLGLVAVLFALLVVWPEDRAPLPARLPARYALANVRVVDVATGAVGAPGAVTVAGGRIASIGAPAGVPVIDGGGAFVVPGFWDMHVHSFRPLASGWHALMLAHGVTAVRDMMDCPAPPDPLVACIEDKRAWSDAALAGARAGPRFAGMASFYFEAPTLTPEEARRRARAYKARGADALKVYNRLPRPAYDAVIAEGRALGLPVVGHLPRAVPLADAIAAGQRSFEHARVLVDACGGTAPEGAAPPARARAVLAGFDAARCRRLIAALAASGAALVPTHVTREEDARAHEPGFDPGRGWLDPLSAWAWADDQAATVSAYPGAEGAALLRGYHRRGLALTGAAHRAGALVLVGTDTVPPGARYPDELALLGEAGLSPAAVLKAATLDAARFAGQDRLYGRVAPGKAAELVLLAADPTRDIAATRAVRGVVFGGRLYGQADLARLKEFARAQARHPRTLARLLWGFATSPAAAEL